MNIAIVNGRVIDPATSFDKVAGVYVEAGRIAAIGRAPERFKIDRTLDAKGLIVAPGLVDLCARLGEPGHEGALKIEMKAALAGGVTSVVCPPDTDPPLDEPGLVRMLRQRSRESAGARTYPLGALTAALKGEALAEIKTLSEAGCVAFMQTRSLPHDNSVLLQAMRYAKTFELADLVAARGRHAGRQWSGRRRRCRRPAGVAFGARCRRNGRAAHDLRVAARDRCADSYLPLVVERRYRSCAAGETRGSCRSPPTSPFIMCI